MNLCTYPDPVQIIDLDDYLGLSLFTINSNFEVIKDASCFLNDSYETLQQTYNTSYTTISALSSDKSRISYASVAFDCNKNAAGNPDTGNTSRFKYASNNISTVIKNSTGNYIINFSPVFSNDSYAVMATASGSYVSPLSASFINTSIEINIRDINGNLYDSDYVSITIFKQ